MKGDNIVRSSEQMKWYDGKTVLETLDNFKKEEKLEEKPFRMPVQGVYKFTKDGDTRRIVAGTVASGELSVGDEVIFYPSGKKSKVKSLEGFNKEKQLRITTGYATGFTLEEQIYITRGEIAALLNEPKPKITSRIKVNLFWLGKYPMEMEKKYLFKLGTTKVEAKIEKINMIIDASNLEKQKKDRIERHDVAECILKLDRAIAFDLAHEIAETSRFVIVDNFEIAGGGIIGEDLEDEQTWIREKILIRDNKWEKSWVSKVERAEKYNQKPSLVLITGQKNTGKKRIAKALEKKLVNDGKIAYFLGIGSVLYGVDADIKSKTTNNKEECFRRLAEVANIMLDAGIILIVTATELTQDDLEIIKSTVNSNSIITIWVEENVNTDITHNLLLPSSDSLEKAVSKIKMLLQNNGIIFKPF